MSAAAIYHCPFCAEEDLRPLPRGEEVGGGRLPRGAWHCRSCLRVFSLDFHGLHHPTTTFAQESDQG